MTSLASLRKRVDKLQRARSQGRSVGGPLHFVEVRLSEPQDVRDARIAEAEAESIAAGWYPGCGQIQCVIVELDDVSEY